MLSPVTHALTKSFLLFFQSYIVEADDFLSATFSFLPLLLLGFELVPLLSGLLVDSSTAEVKA